MPASFLLSLLAGLLAAPPQDNTISLYLTVEEGDRLVGGLTEKNFRLYEDGRPVAFRLEAPESPTLVTLLVEHSRSSWFYQNDIDAAVEAFLSAAPEGPWYSLVTFSHGNEVVKDFTRQIGELRAAYAELGAPMWQDIDTYDAVYETLEKLELLRGRRVLIFIGSGFDTLSARTLGDVQKKIESVNVTVFAAGAGSSLRGMYEPYLGTTARLDLTQAEAFLNMLARKSGGQAWFPKFETAYRDIARTVFLMLENQYRLVYETSLPRDRKFHRLRVEAYQISDDKRKDFRVRVREGWRR
jgi:VWFA-related protein